MNPVCPACGILLGLESRFCHSCGARVLPRSSAAERFTSPSNYTPRHLADRILTSRGALEGEHKRVTVLFCDIASSTQLAERMGEERMYELLDRFFEHALEEVHHYEGTVNQFLGDGFMALFGAPLALEHHEQHAVLCGLGIRRRLLAHFKDFERSAAMPFEIRMGLNTGLVVVGKIGDNLRMDYTAVGDTTNVAAHLQALAAPGDLLIAQPTYESASGVIDAHSLGPVSLKGKSAPLVVYRVLGLRSAAAATEARSTRTLSGFVGRDREMADLMDSLEQAQAGRGQAIGIVSEPGMGKTRLLWEFRQALAGREVNYIEGQCLSYGVGIPYLPILDVLRSTCRIAEGDAPEVLEAKVKDVLSALRMEVDSTLPYLLHLLGAGETAVAVALQTPEGIQSKTFASLRQLCLRASRRRPLVLVVEDLHWVDRTSEAFIGALVDGLAGAAILLIVTYRPGYSPTWMNKAFATQIALRPLPPSGGLAIVQAVLGHLGTVEDLARDIVKRAEGNPLFLEELARAMTEGVGTTTAVPDTLQGALAARIDRLPGSTKRVLQLAAVIGREFSERLLALVWKEGGSLENELLRLTQLEFVYEQGSDDEAVYVFKHALTREAAYGSLLSSRRRVLHGAVGSALESIHADRVDDSVEVLAHHFGLSEDDDKAVDYAGRASQRALRRWANTEAISFSEAALLRLEQMPASEANRLRKIDIVIKQAEVRFALGQHTTQLEALSQVGQMIQPEDDASLRAAWHYWMGFLNSITGGSTEILLSHCEQASTIAKNAELEELGASAECCMAQVYLSMGELNKAIGTGEGALAVFERSGNRWWACRAIAQLSPAANALGEWQRSMAYCNRALEHGIAMDDRRLKASAYIRLASTQIQRGDWQAGLAYCDEAQALEPVQYDAAALRAIKGYGHIKSGDTAGGAAEIAEALAWYAESHQRYTHTQFSTWLAEALVRARLFESARPLLASVLATTRELGYRYLEGVTLRLLAECLRESDVAAATDHLRQSIEVIQSVESENELAKTWLVATSFSNDLVEAWRIAEIRKQALERLRELGTVQIA